MTSRYTALVGTEAATWNNPPSAEQIDATGRALPVGYAATDEQQRLWFGAVVFATSPAYRGGRWVAGDAPFSSRQIAQAVATGRKLGEH